METGYTDTYGYTSTLVVDRSTCQSMLRGLSSDSYQSFGSFSTASTRSDLSPATPGGYFNNNMSDSYADGQYVSQDMYSSADGTLIEDDAWAVWSSPSLTYPPDYMPVDYAGTWSTSTSYTTTMDPSGSTIMMLPIDDTVPRTSESSGLHSCSYHGCDAKAFKRKADLERHWKHKHRPDAEKEQYHCDYPKCGRHSDPFHRVDHCRDHYRDYHLEDLPRKNGTESAEWFDNRKVSTSWWRCTKCLTRNRIDANHRWECSNCKSQCDAQRRNLRGYQ